MTPSESLTNTQRQRAAYLSLGVALLALLLKLGAYALTGSVALVALSGRTVLDPIIAVLVALNIVCEGWRVMAGARPEGLDARLPDADEAKILAVLDKHPQVLGYHRLRSRRAGTGRFAEIDIFVAPELTVLEAHEVAAMSAT